jgi:hypothetical protein
VGCRSVRKPTVEANMNRGRNVQDPKTAAVTFRSVRLAMVAMQLILLSPIVWADDASAICTDRPTKANVPCTVPWGMWQLETDIGNWTHDAHGGGSTDTLYFFDPYIKYGLSPRADIEINWAPAVLVHTRSNGENHTFRGMGDIYLRLKDSLYSGDVFNASSILSVKAPTASRGIGNGRWEAGMIFSMSVTIGGKLILTADPELDALANADGQGRHLSMTNLINMTYPLTGKLSIEVEYWRQDNHAPTGHIKQASSDIAFIYLVTPRLQLDLGANAGMNRATPNEQLYVGLSYR